MLLHRLQRFPNFKLALAQRLLETHSFQGPDISFVLLKGLAQAKIIKKSVILFRVLNMTI